MQIMSISEHDFLNLAQDLIGIISGLLTGRYKYHFEQWPILSN